MNVKKGLLLKEIAGNYVVVAVGGAVKFLNGAVTLNQTGAFLWEMLEKGAEFDELVKALTSTYSVSETVATKDVNDFIEKLKKANLLA